MAPSGYSVRLERVAPRTIAAVTARLAPARISQEFKRYLDLVYEARHGGLELDGQNVFVYRDASDQPGLLDVAFGVGTTGNFEPIGEVRPVELPLGEVAVTTHRGPYSGLAAAHEAVLAWCRARSRTPAGTRWEVYDHWSEGESPSVDVCYLLNPEAGRNSPGSAESAR